MSDMKDLNPSVVMAEDGYVELISLWRSIGAGEGQQPMRVLGAKQVKALTSALQETCDHPVLRTQGHERSRKQRAIWAHPVIALEYARHINPKLAVEINRHFLLTHPKARLAIQAAADDVAEKIAPLVDRIENRLALSDTVIDLGGPLAGLGGDDNDMIAVQGKKYLGLYLMTAAALAKYRGLSGGATILERMGASELGAHAFITYSVLEKSSDAADIEDVEASMHRTATAFREMMLSLGHDPANWPVEAPFKRIPKTLEGLEERLKILEGDHETGL